MWIFRKGDIRTSNFKMKLHLKVCKMSEQTSYTPTLFNSTNAMASGWDRLRGSKQTAEKVGQMVRGDEGFVGIRLENKLQKQQRMYLNFHL